MGRFDAALNRLNRAATRNFGRPFVVRVGAAETALDGIFHAPYRDESVGDLDVRNLSPTVEFITADFAPLGAAERDIVIDGATEYTIVVIEPDDGGMTRCLLRAYP